MSTLDNNLGGATTVYTAPKKPIKKELTIILIIIVLIIVLVVFGYHIIKKKHVSNINNSAIYAFIIDNQKFTKSSIKALIVLPNQLNPTVDNSKVAYNLYKDQITAQNLGINIPQDAIYNQVKYLTQTYKLSPAESLQPWTKLVAYDNALKSLLQNSISTTQAQGYVFNFWYNQHVSAYYVTGTPPSGSDNPSVIAQDKAYASQRANYYQGQLLKNKISPDEVLKQINADVKLNQGFQADSNFSVNFGTNPSISWDKQITLADEAIYITNMKKTEISPIVNASLTTVSGNTKKNLGSYFYFVDLQQLPGKKYNTSTFNSYVEKTKSYYYGI
jgi:hypothetical protein